ncbi:N-formylglutamate amidohydrolase [Rhizobiales bacterium L72]|uniref:N-formylglutamate amidohydrolase n=2 Tax=Propylenella binzhouense TaxID=2555902 RepID=A0A964WTC1_9HYPH|nr:N-formylglutamate amidohydrolase [Propylenella binzhouense]
MTGTGSVGEPPAFEILAPREQTVPFVFNSPHSGAYYPPEFLAATALDRTAIRRSEDLLVDRLFTPVVELGAPLLRAVYPRAYLDVNREPYELDPKMFVGRLPSFANIRSLRVAGGLGTIPRVVGDAANIYKSPIPVDEAIARIDRIYRPYHDALRRLLAETHLRFGCAVLIDCHSMPSNLQGAPLRARPDFILGDRFGASCAPEFIDRAHKVLRELGYTVCRNKPYAGGFITEHYGKPAHGLHALQIEINRALYMDETRLEPHAGFARLLEHMSLLSEALVAIPGEVRPEPLSVAAE